MIWLKIGGISLAVALIVRFEWIRLNAGAARERTALIALAFVCWISALLVVLFPEIPGPMRLIDWLYRPLAGLLR